MNRREFIAAMAAIGGSLIPHMSFGSPISSALTKTFEKGTPGVSQFTGKVLYTVDYQEL